MNIPRPEHPNPQFERANWLNLNGEWEFEIDKSVSGEARRLFEKEHLEGKIILPFCPESSLSGVCEKDFLNAVWYKKTISIKDKNSRIILHIGACDYLTTLYINKEKIGTHKGGYTSFSFDITDYVNIGENAVVINAVDDARNLHHPSGKQSRIYGSHGCYYTRTTGIWQTVWLEFVPENHITDLKFYPDPANCKLFVKGKTKGNGVVTASAFYKGADMGGATAIVENETFELVIPLKEKHLWEVGNGRLYDLIFTFGDDLVKSYFGLRSLKLDGYKFLINGKSVYQRLVLDQGFYPDGIYTAPNEAALINDIKISLDAGFNGARLHEKVFEPRFLYHCDKMGYLAWGEFPNWGFDHSSCDALPNFLSEWMEAVNRDFNHPSIVGWIPFNETWDVERRAQVDALIEIVYKTTKMMDSTRPVVDTSGNFHVTTDIFDLHDYEQDTDTFKETIRIFNEEGNYVAGIEKNDRLKGRQFYKGEPVFLSEYGGIKWDIDGASDSWGYGNAPKTEEEFIKRYEGLTLPLLESPKLFGFCYTQLYDVEQEINGLYDYYRNPKCDISKIYEINTKKAAIE